VDKYSKKKILYFMHVDWNWIKQRPHFIAEGLADSFDIDIYYPVSRKRNIMTFNKPSNKINSLKKYFRLPYFLRKYSFFKNLSNLLVKSQISNKKYDYVFFTHPDQVNFLPKGFEGKVIYDCMDDHTQFEGVDVNDITCNEQVLCDISDIVLISSNNLGIVLHNRYNLDKSKVDLVRNGLSNNLDIKYISEPELFNNKVIYLGTISEWIDFDVISELINNNLNITIDFAGPITVPVFTHERINYLGAVSHSDISTLLSNYSCFIMPFKVNELIKSVDPVKLYEYIYFGGDVVSCYYPEIERFDGFVSFYRNREELIDLFVNIENLSTNRINKKLRAEFLLENTWSKRCEQVNAAIGRVAL
jgi:teichuronic acid biosynthesis glycosyltransferase TuaH